MIHHASAVRRNGGSGTISVKKLLVIVLGIAVTVGCLWLAFQGTDFEDVVQKLANADYRWLPVLLGLLFAFFWIKAIRWHLLLQPVHPLGTAQVFPALMIGFMGNNVLPAHLGDFIRIYVLSKQYELKKVAVFSTYVLERIFDVASIVLILGIGLAMVPELSAKYRTASLIGLTASSVGFAGIAIYVIWTHHIVALVEWTFAKLPFIPRKLTDSLLQMLHAGETGLASIRQPLVLLGVVATSLLQWVANGLMIYICLWNFGLNPPIAASFIVLGIVAFGVVLPSTPGFFGIIQQCFIIAMTPFMVTGDKPEVAAVLGASIYYHLVQYIPVTAVGLIYAYTLGFQLTKLEDQAENLMEEPTDILNDETSAAAVQESPAT